MNLDSRFRWSFKSADLGANFAIVVCLFLLGGIALLAGFSILALVLIAIGLARAVSWYINLPISATDPLPKPSNVRQMLIFRCLKNSWKHIAPDF